MSINDDTEKIARAIRGAARRTSDAETRALLKAWDRAWRQIVNEWEAAVDQVLTAEPPLTIGQVRRLNRARSAVDATTRQLKILFDAQAKRLPTLVDQLVTGTATGNARLIATQYPRTEGTRAELTARFDRVDPDALDAIVRRTTKQITALSRPLTKQATEEMLRALTRAIPEGQSPRTAARQLLKSLEGRFNGGRSRALTIMRTEVLDAYRDAAAAQQMANADVLQGWVWTAQLDSRTCASCVAQHGSVHSLEEPGPLDHQNGRCARTPLVKPWRALGIDQREPVSKVKTGPEWFAEQPAAVQMEILGPGRLDAITTGRASWDDLSQRRSVDGWRDSFVPAPASAVA